MRLALKRSLRIFSFTVSSTVSKRESRETRNFLLRPSIRKVISERSDTTMGRAPRLCGLTGEMIKLSDSGKTKGPPQLNEYPVDPVGVDTITPSAQYELSSSPSTDTCTVIIDEVSFFMIVKSLRAKRIPSKSFGSDTRRSMVRSSME